MSSSFTSVNTAADSAAGQPDHAQGPPSSPLLPELDSLSTPVTYRAMPRGPSIERLPPEVLLHAIELSLPPVKSGKEVLKALEAVPNLQEVCIEDGEVFQESELAGFYKLEHLTLAFTALASFSPLVFPNLVSLTIYNVHSGLYTVLPKSPTSSLPSLKALYLCPYWTHGEFHCREWAVDLIRLGDQLDMLQLHWIQSPCIPAAMMRLEVPIGFVLDFDGGDRLVSMSLVSLKHFLLNAWIEEDDEEGHLTRLTDAIAQHEHIQSLSLPSLRHPSSSLHTSLIPVRNRLLATCASKKVDLIWRMHATEPMDDFSVSRDFWSYAKDLKRREALEAEGRAGGSKNI
ncbi:hypothetical protein JCM8547_007011 [Rhodosporidiobolus lusitaniae]